MQIKFFVKTLIVSESMFVDKLIAMYKYNIIGIRLIDTILF
jgi:hypothetical protein